MQPLVLAALLLLAADGDKPRLDCFGDPLPEGALARMGTVRMRYDDGGKHAVALSADHATLVTAGSAIDVWNTADGAHVRSIPEGRAETIALSPDGKTLAWANEKGFLSLIDLATGKETRRLAEPGEGGYYALTFSPDGKTLAVGGNGVVRFWDPAEGKLLREWTWYKASVTLLSYSRDGSRLAASTEKAGSRIAETATGKVLATFSHGRSVLAPDGKTAFGGDGPSFTDLRGTEGDKAVRRLQCDFGSLIEWPFGFTADGKTLWTTAYGQLSELWDVQTGKQLVRLFGEAHALSADGKVAALCCREGAVRLVDGTTGEDLRPELGHSDHLYRVAFSPDGRTLLTGAGDGAPCLWKADSGKYVRRLAPDGGGTPATWTFSPDGKSVTALADVVYRWDAATGKVKDGPSGTAEQWDWKAVASPDGRLLLRWGPEGAVRIWDVQGGKEVRVLPAVEGVANWEACAVSPDGGLAAALAVQGRGPTTFNELLVKVAVWNVATGRHVRTIQVPCTVAGECWPKLCLTGRTLILTVSGQIHRLDIATGEELGSVLHGGDILALSPDGRLFAAGGWGGGVSMWETATGKELRSWVGHPRPVSALAFSPDGKALATGSYDATALIWDVAGRLKRPEALGTDEKRDALWADLAGDDAARAHAAVQTFAAFPGQAVPFLKEKLRPATATADAQRLTRLIADLDDDHFPTREKATDELIALRREAAPALRQALAAGPSAEVRQRIGDLLARLLSFTAEELRALRAVHALEWMNTAEARQVLEELAKGAPEVVRTEEAREALLRLRKGLAASSP